MIEEIEKKLAVEKSRLTRLEVSQKKCMEKIRDYEATIRVLAEIINIETDAAKEKKKTASDYIIQTLRALAKPISKADLVAFMKFSDGVELNDNTIVGTLQRLRTRGIVDCKDNLWVLKTYEPTPAEKSAEEDEDLF